MSEIPCQLLEALSPEAVAVVGAWWGCLSDNSKDEIISLWDERCDADFFRPLPPEPGGPETDVVPKVFGGKFVPNEDTSGWDEWHAAYFEHLVNHPDLGHLEMMVPRIFHIGCTAHEAARVALATGKIPADFTCPLRSVGCPMRKLLDIDPKFALQLTALTLPSSDEATPPRRASAGPRGWR